MVVNAYAYAVEELKGKGASIEWVGVDLKILEEHVTSPLGLGDDELLEHLYQTFRDLLEAKPYPHPLAVYNVFRLALMDNPELEAMNPWELWDTHILRILDDGGFIKSLY